MISLMKPAALLLAVCIRHVVAKAVFAHYMVGNTEGYGAASWSTEMLLAKSAGIDAFALNIARDDPINDDQLPTAFAAAESLGFHLFFSLDYAGNGAWDKADVISLIQSYGRHGAYYHYNGAPLVSTFEGPSSAADWTEIKASTGCFFIPDWSSQGAKAALELENGVADGLFNWAAWSWGGDAMNTYTDASYLQYLDGKPYMMPASGWFYTNLPGYDKNWMWPVLSMDLWEQRWNQILYIQPEFVEIISWNDFGESHYIGPTKDSPPFQDGKDAFDYVSGIDHTGWLAQLSVWSALYKTGEATITSEMITAAYLTNHVEDCSAGDTTLNTASQLQYEYSPSDVFSGSYYISYTAMLGSEASVTVTVGGESVSGPWLYKPGSGVGVYRGEVFIGTKTGDVAITLHRDGSTIASIDGPSIGGCTDGYTNFNPAALVGFSDADVAATTSPNIADQVCTAGTGAQGFDGICAITCKYGYCPTGACVCTAIGEQKTLPDPTGLQGYAKSDTNYIGLCSWSYTYGFADEPSVSEHCSSTENTLTTPTVSPFLPFVCTAGTGNGNIGGDDIDRVCDFSCSYGWCPINVCRCTSTGALADLPKIDDSTLHSAAAAQYGTNRYIADMCGFTCEYGYCPLDVCYTPPNYDHTTNPDGSGEPTGDWMTISCNHGSLASDLNPGPQRWDDADAEEAWADALAWFEDYKASAAMETTDSDTTYNGFEFSQIIADRVHATSNRLCEYVPNTQCDTTVPCDSQDTQSATGVSSPAGYMITNSIANIHGMIDQLWNAIDHAVSDYNGHTTEIVDKFEDLSEGEKLKLELDIVNLIYGVVAAPFWNSWAKTLLGDDLKTLGNTLGTMKDSINSLVSNSLTTVKDTLGAAQGVGDAVAFQELGTSIGDGMKAAIVANARYLFNGTDTEAINGLVTNGSSAGVWSRSSPTVETDNFYKALVIASIPVAWSQIGASTAGVFWMTGEALHFEAGEDLADITTCEGANAAAQNQLDYMRFFDYETVFVCDTANDKPYWLIMLGKECTYSKPNFSWICSDQHPYQPPPGTSSIDGTNFAGLKLEDLLMRSNGDANGWGAPDLNNWDAIVDVGEKGIQAPGLFPIPICSWEEAGKNWDDMATDKRNYPCN